MHPLVVVLVGVAGVGLSLWLAATVGFWPAVGGGLLTVAAEVVAFTRHPASAGVALTVGAAGAILVYAGVA
jgi:hypothetical protein